MEHFNLFIGTSWKLDLYRLSPTGHKFYFKCYNRLEGCYETQADFIVI